MEWDLEDDDVKEWASLTSGINPMVSKHNPNDI